MSSAIWYTIRATGVVALVLLTVTTVLGMLSASRVRSRRWPAFALVDLHKRATMFALVFLGLHVATAVVDTYVQVGVLSAVVPFVSPFRTVWTGLGTIAVDLLVAVAVSSALRRRIAARTWRALHWLAYGCWPLAMAHALGTGTDAGQLWMDVVAGACSVAVACALTWRIGYHRTTRTGGPGRGHDPRPGPPPPAARHPTGPGRARPPGTVPTARTSRTAPSTPAPTTPVPSSPAATGTRLLERDPR